MNKNIDLRNDSIKSSFYRYLLPAIAAMIIKSLYVMVDAMFVGVGVGSDGLGAISLTVPFFSLSAAIALTIGIGGSSLMSIQLGKGDERSAQSIFSQSVLLILIIAVTLVTLVRLNIDAIIHLMGATGELAQYATDYLSVMLPFFVFHGLWWVISAFVRNDTNPSLVMKATIGSAITNVILDYVFIFIFKWGVKGAALATGLSQVLTFLILLTHFKSSKGMLKLSFRNIKFTNLSKIITTGLPTFFVESTTAVSVIIFNYILLKNYTPLHVSAYGIVMNVGLVGLFLLIGIGQACQPIISFNFGSGRFDRIRETLLLGLKFSIATGFLVLSLTMIGSTFLASLFTRNDQELINLASKAMKIYFIAPPFMAFNTIVATLFQSIVEPGKATIIALSRGFIFVIAGLLLLPLLSPQNGVWGSVVFAEAVTAIYSLSILSKYLVNQRLNSKSKMTINS